MPILPASMAAFIRCTGSYRRRLADDAQERAGPAGGGQHGIAVGQAGGQRLLDQGVDAGGRRPDHRIGVQRMRRGDQHGLDAGLRRRVSRSS